MDEERLQPGDAVVIYSDGMVDARTADGAILGDARLAAWVVKSLAADLPAAEMMRRLARAVVDYQYEKIVDDATALLIRWHPDDRSA